MTSAAEAERPVILFDGVCNLCTANVRFVIARNKRKQFRFASLQSPAVIAEQNVCHLSVHDQGHPCQDAACEAAIQMGS